jgi:hypothetical protein
MAKNGKFIVIGGNQGDRLRFSEFSVTSKYIKNIAYMHIEGFYFPSNYTGPHSAAPVYQGAASLNQQFGINVKKSDDNKTQ